MPKEERVGWYLTHLKGKFLENYLKKFRNFILSYDKSLCEYIGCRDDKNLIGFLMDHCSDLTDSECFDWIKQNYPPSSEYIYSQYSEDYVKHLYCDELNNISNTLIEKYNLPNSDVDTVVFSVDPNNEEKMSLIEYYVNIFIACKTGEKEGSFAFFRIDDLPLGYFAISTGCDYFSILVYSLGLQEAETLRDIWDTEDKYYYLIMCRWSSNPGLFYNPQLSLPFVGNFNFYLVNPINRKYFYWGV